MSVLHQIDRPVRSLHQIELTSRCNLRCVYCTSPSIVKGEYPGRTAGDMTREHFGRAMEWVRHFVAKGTQDDELNLAGIGESTLHPDLCDFILAARQALGTAKGPSGEVRRIAFATNGLAFTEDHARALVEAKPAGVWVSMHRPEKAEPAIEIAKRFGVFLAATIDPAVMPNAWAGQVKWRAPTYTIPCAWLVQGRVFALSDGRVSACCLDAQGIGVIGHLDDDPATARTKTYGLCPGCHHTVSRTDFDRLQAIGAIKP